MGVKMIIKWHDEEIEIENVDCDYTSFDSDGPEEVEIDSVTINGIELDPENLKAKFVELIEEKLLETWEPEGPDGQDYHDNISARESNYWDGQC